MGAVVVVLAGAGTRPEWPNHCAQGAFPHDMARAMSGTRASADQAAAAARRPAMPGAAVESQQEMAGKAEAMFVA